MKYLIFAVLCLFSAHLGAFSNDGDFENRLREAEISGDKNQAAAVCREWYESGTYSPAWLDWNYNALMSVENDALLFTQQDNDTYPALLLQYALQVRTDVKVVSLNFLEDSGYRKALLDGESWTWIKAESSVAQLLDQLQHPPKTLDKPLKPLYFGVMVHKNLLSSDKQQFYLTGLALKFSPINFDNVAVLRYNFENRFRLDNLDVNFSREKDSEVIASANLNYLPALLLLQKHYSTSGESDKAEKVERIALRIAEKGGKSTEVRAYFAPEKAETPIVSDISPKTLDKTFKKINERLYASETETSNAQFEAFLTDLVKNKEFDQLAVCKTTKTDWMSLLPEELRKMPESELFRHGHPDGAGAPVQNITFEAAQKYCEWITKVYNASPEKKKFKKVIFRLPTEDEWMFAASGGNPKNPYPWGGFYVRNAKGCYLGNYDAKEPCSSCPDQSSNLLPDSNDGGYFTVPVDSYYPNKFGLYAVSGNVAEMINEAGKTKGGSWQDEPYYGQTKPVKMHQLPSPAVGFRVFMEVIEE